MLQSSHLTQNHLKPSCNLILHFYSLYSLVSLSFSSYSFYPGLVLITQQHAYILAGLTQILLDCFDKFSSQWARSLKLLQKQFHQLLSHRVAVYYISSYPEMHGSYFCWLEVSAHFSTNCPLPSLQILFQVILNPILVPIFNASRFVTARYLSLP